MTTFTIPHMWKSYLWENSLSSFLNIFHRFWYPYCLVTENDGRKQISSYYVHDVFGQITCFHEAISVWNSMLQAICVICLFLLCIFVTFCKTFSTNNIYMFFKKENSYTFIVNEKKNKTQDIIFPVCLLHLQILQYAQQIIILVCII